MDAATRRARDRFAEGGSAVLASLLVARLAGSPGGAARTLVTAVAVAVAGRLLRRRRRLLPVGVEHDGRRFTFHIDDLTDLQVLREVFHQRIYAMAAVVEPKLVLDMGANLGATVAYFKCLWPDARIEAFEPDPWTFEKLRRSVGHLDGVRLHQAAVGPEDGEVTLWSSVESWRSSVLGPLGPEARPVRVPQRSLTSIFASLGDAPVDLLKLDVEGAEFALLPELGAHHRVAALIGELHFDLAPAATVGEVLRQLEGFDVTLHGDSRRRMEIAAVRRDPDA